MEAPVHAQYHEFAPNECVRAHGVTRHVAFTNAHGVWFHDGTFAPHVATTPHECHDDTAAVEGVPDAVVVLHPRVRVRTPRPPIATCNRRAA